LSLEFGEESQLDVWGAMPPAEAADRGQRSPQTARKGKIRSKIRVEPHLSLVQQANDGIEYRSLS
jgi:hypothetical protein